MAYRRTPATPEPDKIYGRKEAAAFAGVSPDTITRWERGWGRTDEQKEASALLEWGIDVGYTDLIPQEQPRADRPTRHNHSRSKWYRKSTLLFLGKLARDNKLLRETGHLRLMRPARDPEARADVLDRVSNADYLETVDLDRQARIASGRPGLYLLPSPSVRPAPEDVKAAREMRDRLVAEAAARNAAKDAAARAEALASVDELPEAERERARALILGEPVPARPAGSEKPVSATARRHARVHDARAEALVERARVRDAKIAAWRAKYGFDESEVAS